MARGWSAPQQRRPSIVPVIVLAVAVVFLIRACSSSSDSGNSGGSNASGPTSVNPSNGNAGAEVPDNCVAIDVAVSSEKIRLMTDLAQEFNDSKEADKAAGGKCAFVRVAKKSSGAAQQLLAERWPDPDADGAQPVVWSPASSAWGAILNQRLADKGEQPMVSDAEPFMLTPLVIAMPKPMADALGYPDTPIGYGDIIALAKDPAGWGAKGHPEWGPFKLGKTNPNFSTSALSATIAQYYAATGKSGDLSLEDLNRPDVDQFARAVESAVVHYGDITMTFLNNWFRNDVRGSSLTYVSAVAVEEKSVIDYNAGNPDGELSAGEKPRKPRVPLVAIYPKEGTLFSDNPFIVLDAPWVNANEKAGATAFQKFVLRPEAQKRVLEFGFRPGNPDVAVSAPITEANGVDPNQPQTILEVPEPKVLTRMLDLWADQRKGARVLLVLDVSGSMGDPADDSSNDTKLDLAKQAAIDALDQFKADDLVGLRVFTTNASPTEPTDYLDLVPVGPLGSQQEAIVTKIRQLQPLEGTPLYTTAKDSFEFIRSGYDPSRINAVVLLTDGQNQDDRNSDLDGLLDSLSTATEGGTSRPVRVFTIGYGRDADLATLKRIAEATNASTYDASNPRTIANVFVNVLSNF